MDQPTDTHFLYSLDEESALLSILEGTATETGEAFFDALVVNLSQALKTKGALITERLGRSRHLKTLAAWFNGEINHGYVYDFSGTPCETVIEGARYIHVSEGLRELYPDSKEHREGITSYLGAPLKDTDGTIMGNLAVFDSLPMPEKAKELAVFRIFAARAAAELQRLRAERKLRASEQKYRSIVEATNEGYVFTDEQFAILDVNDAFCQMTGFKRADLLSRGLDDFCDSELGLFLRSNCRDLVAMGKFEVKGKLKNADGRRFPALIHGSVLQDISGRNRMGIFVTDLTTAEKSLTLAAEIQQSMLPAASPQIEGLDIAGRNQPCENVGGDYFDIIQSPKDSDSSLTVAVGDVSGHGVDAALLMTSARTCLHMLAPHAETMSHLVNGLNRHLISEAPQTHHFMTLFILAIDAVKRSLEWVRAGHEPALLFDPESNHFTELKGSGLALGVDPAHEYRVNRLEGGVSDRQILVLGTDGIWEARDINGEPFGKDRLCEVVRSHAHQSAQHIVAAVFDAVNTFAVGTIADDDKTLVVIRPAHWAPDI